MSFLLWEWHRDGLTCVIPKDRGDVFHSLQAFGPYERGLAGNDTVKTTTRYKISERLVAIKTGNGVQTNRHASFPLSE